MVLFSALYGAPHAVENSAAVPVAKQEMASSTTIENYTRAYYKDTPILAEIAKCESQFSQFDKDGNVVRGRKNKADVGIMQINEYYHLEDSKNVGIDIYTIDGNLAYGKRLYDIYGTSAWKSSQKCWGKYDTSNDLAKN